MSTKVNVKKKTPVTTKAAWISAGATVVVALIALFSSKSGHSGNNNVKKIESGSGIQVDSLSQKGALNVAAGRDAIVTIGDTTPKKGDSYIVTSNGQKGGITAGKVIINKNITIIKSDDVAGKNVKDNYLVQLDTNSHMIYFQPKIGKWTQPFIGFSQSEILNVQAHFLNEGKNIKLSERKLFIQGDTLHVALAVGDPATKDFYYSMHYNGLPPYLVFGNYPSPLYKVSFK